MFRTFYFALYNSTVQGLKMKQYSYTRENVVNDVGMQTSFYNKAMLILETEAEGVLAKACAELVEALRGHCS